MYIAQDILVEYYYNIIYRMFKLTSLSIDRAECRMFTYNNTYYMTWYIPRLYLPCLIIYTTAVVLYINIIILYRCRRRVFNVE